MDINSTLIPGCFEIVSKYIPDTRGEFIKFFNFDLFHDYGLEVDFKEEYCTISKKNVIRGMHFQIPPMDHVKKVYCISGEVMDVVLDLRKGSPFFNKYQVFHLSSVKGNQLYIPKGCAHGFFAHTESAKLNYHVSSVYSSEHDTGILWDSFGFDWPIKHPILSERDKSFSPLNKFQSPFYFSY